jgi:hypothetical protein
MPMVKHVTVVPQIDPLHRHTGNSTYVCVFANTNNVPADSTSVSLGCNVFSEQMMQAVQLA